MGITFRGRWTWDPQFSEQINRISMGWRWQKMKLSPVFVARKSPFFSVVQHFLGNVDGILDFLIGIEDVLEISATGEILVRSASCWSKSVRLPMKIIARNRIAHSISRTNGRFGDATLTLPLCLIFQWNLIGSGAGNGHQLAVKSIYALCWNDGELLLEIAFPCCHSYERQLFRLKDPERMRCDAMRQISGDNKEQKKKIQISEVSKYQEFIAFMRKIHSLIFTKGKWLCIWVFPPVDIFQSSDNVGRSFWKIVANSVHQLLTTKHDHNYSIKQSFPSKNTSITQIVST
jgi:hypothetical protein